MVKEEMSFKRFLIRSSNGPPVDGAEPFMQFWKRTSWGTFKWSYKKFGLVVQEEMSFKENSYQELCQPLCSVDWNHLCNFWKKASWGTLLWNYFEFEPIVPVEMPFKGISYLELWQPCCSADRHYCAILYWGYYEEQFCEVILNLGK